MQRWKVNDVLEPGGMAVFARSHPESGPASAGCSRSGKRDHENIDFHWFEGSTMRRQPILVSVEDLLFFGTFQDVFLKGLQRYQ